MRVVPLVATLTLIAFASVFGQTNKTTWDGIFTEAQAASGEQLYSASCASCHGSDLAGGEMAPSLVAGEFMASWNDLSLKDLLNRMYDSMPQNAPRSLSREQDADILSFVLRKEGFPAGASRLSSQAVELQDIKFLATKP